MLSNGSTPGMLVEETAADLEIAIEAGRQGGFFVGGQALGESDHLLSWR